MSCLCVNTGCITPCNTFFLSKLLPKKIECSSIFLIFKDQYMDYVKETKNVTHQYLGMSHSNFCKLSMLWLFFQLFIFTFISYLYGNWYFLETTKSLRNGVLRLEYQVCGNLLWPLDLATFFKIQLILSCHCFHFPKLITTTHCHKS